MHVRYASPLRTSGDGTFSTDTCSSADLYYGQTNIHSGENMEEEVYGLGTTPLS